MTRNRYLRSVLNGVLLRSEIFQKEIPHCFKETVNINPHSQYSVKQYLVNKIFFVRSKLL